MSPELSNVLLGVGGVLFILAGLVVLIGGALVLADWLQQRREAQERQDAADRYRLRCAAAPTPCRPGDHDWILPARGRSGYCIRCGASYPLTLDRRTADTAIIELKADDGGRP